MRLSVIATIIATITLGVEAVSIREDGYYSVQRRQNKFGQGNRQNGQQNKGAASSTAAAATASAAAKANTGKNNGAANNGQNNNANAALTLNPNNIQKGSQADGQATPAAGQSASLTDGANFINFCTGQTLTDGLQVKGGSCNGIVMGKIPSQQNMITGIIVSPKPGEDLTPNQTFDLKIQTKGLAAGSFTNAAATYYSAPQNLNGQGQIIGHTHLTVQDLGSSLAPTTPPDPVAFVFFKGINDAGNNQGLLTATVTGGLPTGNYRVCSMTSSSNHQPVLMPVAQRGAQDDCQKFTVGKGTGNANAGGNGANANAGNNNANKGGKQQ